MLSLLTTLQARGLEATATGPDTAALVVAFAYREIGADLDAVLQMAAGEVELDLIVPVLSLSSERLAVALPNGSTRALFDSDNDELHLVVTHSVTEPDADVIVDSVEQACAALRALLDAGVVDVVDASDDEEIARALSALQRNKERSPRQAVEAARATADRSRSLGNPSLASFLDIAAAEVLIELGDIHLAAELVEPAWEQLDEPAHWREVVTVVAQLRARQGDLALAVALLEDALAQQDDQFDAAVIRGDLGVLLAQSGRRVEASQLLGAAADDEHLDEPHRSHFRSQLDLLRGRPREAARAPADSIDATNARLNELAAILLQDDRRTLAASSDRLRDLIAEVSADIPHLGPSQQVRFSMAQGCLAVLDDRPDVAGKHFDHAVDLADQSGDVDLARWVRGQATSLLHPTGVASTAQSSTPMERLAVLLNRAVAELPENVACATTAVREAMELADTERHRYSSVADRAAWAALVSRVYEVGLASSLAAGDHPAVIEILERARAQGAPSPSDEKAARRGAVPPGDDDDLSSHLLRLTRESLGDRPVARPLVASTRSDGQIANGSLLRVDLDRVIEAIAGGPAWWWTCHSFGERVYWALRSPDGETWAGATVLPGGLDATAELAEAFRSVRSAEDLRSHPLGEDQDSRLESTLAEVAKYLLPRPLVDALTDAAGREEPIRLIWAAPPALARIPVSILPIGADRVVLDGASVVLAPPTSLAIAMPRSDVGSRDPRAALLILGGDADLGMLRDLAEAIAPDRGAVLGAARHVKAGVAGSLASPRAVLEALRSHPGAIGVYYGHIDDDGPFSYSASLSLTDGLRRCTLEASEMLTEARGGAPHVMILAGCSSLSASHLGTGEWWGLATAFLWQGAHHVIGSTWDLLPTTTTRAFVAELTSELLTHRDPMMVLRAAQRAMHERWKTTGRPCPYEWAGWSLVSAGASLQ